MSRTQNMKTSVQTKEELVRNTDNNSLQSSTVFGRENTADQTSQVTGSRAQTAGRHRELHDRSHIPLGLK